MLYEVITIKSIFKIGNGPSSSHTMGPKIAATQFKERNPGTHTFRVTLYGSLAATGKGHLTDVAITDALKPQPVEFTWLPEIVLPRHTNGMKFEAVSANGQIRDTWTVYSIGGGKIVDENSHITEEHIYKDRTMSEVLSLVENRGKTFWEYVQDHEESDIWDYLVITSYSIHYTKLYETWYDLYRYVLR